MKSIRIIILALIQYLVYWLLVMASEAIGLAAQPIWHTIVILLLSILVTFVLCKWYFRYITPTTLEGAILGGFGAILFLLINWVFSGFSYGFGVDTLFLLVAIEVLFVSIYAGFEFDTTFTKTSK